MPVTATQTATGFFRKVRIMKKSILAKAFCTILLGLTLSLFVSAVSREGCLNAIICYSTIDYENADKTVLNSFSDANGLEEHISKIVSAAFEKGIINGYGDGTLRLENEVTRAEIACMIYRAKDYYPAFSEKLCESNVYEDLSDWNADAIRYCMENGYMVGYGDAFGAEDIVTEDQLSVIVRRLRFGCNTREKYFVRQLCGTSPIDLNATLLSAYDDTLKENVFRAFPESAVSTNESAEVIKDRMETLFEKLGNLDYRKLANEEYRADLEANFRGNFGPDSFMGINSSTIRDITEQAIADKTIRESICVFSPTSCQAVSIMPGYTVTRAYGYEYFCEKSAEDGLNEEQWYRRTVKAEIDKSATNVTLSCVYGEPEKI